MKDNANANRMIKYDMKQSYERDSKILSKTAKAVSIFFS